MNIVPEVVKTSVLSDDTNKKNPVKLNLFTVITTTNEF